MDEDSFLEDLTVEFVVAATPSIRIQLRTNFGVGFSFIPDVKGSNFLYPLSPCCMGTVDAVGSSGRRNSCGSCGKEYPLALSFDRYGRDPEAFIHASSGHLDPLRSIHVSYLLVRYIEVLLARRKGSKAAPPRALAEVLRESGVI